MRVTPGELAASALIEDTVPLIAVVTIRAVVMVGAGARLVAPIGRKGSAVAGA